MIHLAISQRRMYRRGAEYAEKKFFVKKYSELGELCASVVKITLCSLWLRLCRNVFLR